MALRDLLRVLVVDDMSTSRGIILQALDSFGIRNVTYAIDGRSALSALSNEASHLVISDYNMPDLDGLSLLGELRAHPSLSGIGFILVTGQCDQIILNRGRKLGMNNYVIKPFTPTDLQRCIEAVVGRL